MGVEKAIQARELREAGIDPEYFSVALSSLSAAVQAVRWDEPREVFTICFKGSERELDELLDQARHRIGRKLVGRDARVLYAREGGAPASRDTWGELCRQGMVRDFGGGHVAYRGFFLTLVEQLDSLLADIAQGEGASPIHLPQFAPMEYLRKLGTLDQHPHHLYFVAPLRSGLQEIEEFQRRSAAGAPAVREFLGEPEHCLKISACYLLYPLLEGAELAEEQRYTMLGHCTRHESVNTLSFERLTEFRMREVVYVGDEAGAERFRQFAVTLFRDILETFELSARIMTARDAFFLSNYEKYGLMQLLSGDKLEARARIADTQAEIAVGSFNYHRNFFSRRCGISFRGEAAATACVGFGLERLAYALLSQQGLDSGKLEGLLRRLRQRRGLPEAIGGGR
jgi:seryl-tRNA synthetase